MTDVTTIDALNTALRAAAVNANYLTLSDLADIRTRVREAVGELKTLGAPPEHVVVAIKTITGGIEFDPNRDGLREQVVTWAIEFYFEPPSFTL